MPGPAAVQDLGLSIVCPPSFLDRKLYTKVVFSSHHHSDLTMLRLEGLGPQGVLGVLGSLV